jgi:acetyl esterase/lipase
VSPRLGAPVTLSAIAFKSGMTNSTVWSDLYDRESGQSPVLTMDTLSSSSPRSVTYNLDKAGKTEGDYIFTVVYRAAKDEPVRFYVHGGPQIWVGEARSNPVAVTFHY